MKGLFIVVTVVIALAGLGWAVWRPVSTPPPAGAAKPSSAEKGAACCQKSPNRLSLLQAKPAPAP
jgi:hypothetical protein